MKLPLGLGFSIAVAFALMSSPLAGQELALRYAPEAGEPHPDFVLPRIDNGQPLRLSDFRGQKVLLLHFASW